MNNFYFIILVCFLYACNSGKLDADDISSKLIAKAGNENLNFYDFKTDFISNGNKKDSALSAIKTIENWATEALFYQEAISKLNSDEIEIDKQVQSYKKSLVNHIYQTKLIEANLDTIISIKEIQNYYNAHRDNFILKSKSNISVKNMAPFILIILVIPILNLSTLLVASILIIKYFN